MGELYSIIVESSFRARRELVSLLETSGLTNRIEEAPSVSDALHRFELGHPDLCLVGRNLSLERATWFLANAIEVKVEKPCAFVALTTGPEHYETLLDAGADVVSWEKLAPRTFTSLVEQAIERARSRHEKVPSAAESTFIDERLTRAPSYDRAALSDVLLNLSERLELIAQEISRGRMKTSPTGLPTLAVEDCLRLTIENAFPKEAAAWRVGSENHAFVSSIVEWFLDRIHMDSRRATELLRKRLTERK